MRTLLRICCAFVAIIPGLPSLAASEAGPAAPVPRVRQTTLPNPVADEVALMHRSRLTSQQGEIARLSSVIEVIHEAEGLGYAWDPVECRLLFAWRGQAMRDLVCVAEGPAPLSSTIGGWGPPAFFGYRLAEGAVEFLYHYGRLAVAERLQPQPGGASLEQRWSIHQAPYGVQLAVPERWRSRVKASAGTWAEGSLKVDAGAAKQFTLTWTWPASPDLPELPASWLSSVGLSPVPPPAP